MEKRDFSEQRDGLDVQIYPSLERLGSPTNQEEQRATKKVKNQEAALYNGKEPPVKMQEEEIIFQKGDVMLDNSDAWEVVKEGFEEPTTTMGYTAAQTKVLKEARSKDKVTLYMLFRAVDESGFEKIYGPGRGRGRRGRGYGRDGQVDSDEGYYKEKGQSSQLNWRGRGIGQGRGGRSNYSNIECYKCYKYGHYIKDCNSEKCYNCGKVGNFAKDCRANKKVEETTNLALEDERMKAFS
ncbi:uncharacterized protein LOC120187826 [Hibiscus syriacus]|uniref:uncharacterized protein LOC120187826 n=1 Tax=Hibiscus syriacus TaxID=106335 RepID=UPI0019236045|nr:uncharacterized protein LOC120187826 [Hibiscus syriacus]